MKPRGHNESIVMRISNSYLKFWHLRTMLNLFSQFPINDVSAWCPTIDKPWRQTDDDEHFMLCYVTLNYHVQIYPKRLIGRSRTALNSHDWVLKCSSRFESWCSTGQNFTRRIMWYWNDTQVPHPHHPLPPPPPPFKWTGFFNYYRSSFNKETQPY